MNGLIHIALEASIRAAVAASCVGAILALARVRSGAVRHAAWTAVLCAMLLMPVLPRITPEIGVPVVSTPVFREADTEIAPPAMPVRPLVQASATPMQAPAVPLAAPAPAPRGALWPWAALAAYLAGVLILLARLAVGWRSARSLARTAEPVAVPLEGVRVCQSGAVATPLTVGVLRPRVLLPHTWTEWSGAKLCAVLAHEAAHVRRRDGVVALAARLNRCLFWFHPFAWWLERQLAVTAEQACDEAAVRAVGQSGEYADILLEMAEAVRRKGGRLAWQGIGMDGGGALECRIDRILRGDLARRMSRPRKAAVAVACAAAIFLAAACRQNSDSVLMAQAQREAAEYARRSARFGARQKEHRDREAAARTMTAGQAAALEAEVRKNPDDPDARRKLLDFYYARLNAQVRRIAYARLSAQVRRTTPTAPPVDPVAVKATIAAGMPHTFWLIEHHPEDFEAPLWSRYVFPSPYNPQPDPAYLERARKLWVEQADRDGRPAAVYANALGFFSMIDKPLAEKTLLRGQAADPKGETLEVMGPWTLLLGRFYGELLSSQRPVPANANPVAAFYQAHGAIDPQSAYAVEVRRKLEQSKDVQLLLFTADSLVSMQNRQHGPDYDPIAFGKTLIHRALEFQPDSTWARQLLNVAADQELIESLPEAVWNGPFESRHQAIQALPDGDRFRELALLAIAEGDQAVYAEVAIRSLPPGEQGRHADVVRNDAANAPTNWQHAGQYAQEALDLASKARNHPDYGMAFFNANMVLGMAAIKNGDAKSAAAYLLKAADAPATDALKYPIGNARPWPTNWQFPNTLAAALLQAGERDAVVAFLEKYAHIIIPGRGRTLVDIAAIRSGKLPEWAQAHPPRS
jgi:beta-lactamase regulating signal transducer with metallopeptidase domain